jgi:hypothetical protein
MTYRDGSQREMAKWAHHRLARERQEAEEEQRKELTHNEHRGVGTIRAE